MTTHTVSLGPAPAVATYPPGAAWGPRLLTDFELVWMLSGSARWRPQPAAQEVALTPGTLLLARPGMRDAYRWDPVRPSTHGYVHFHLAPPPATEGWPLTVPLPAEGPLSALLDYLLWLAGEPSMPWRGRAEEVVGLVVRLLVEGPLPGARPAAEPPPLAAAWAHVGGVWASGMRPIPLHELAGAASVTPAHLSRLVRRHVGSGPIAALERIRLAAAEPLLLRSDLTITLVARAVGFPDPLHFSRRFRAVHGLSPRAYRDADPSPPSALTTPALRALSQRLSRN